MHSVGKRDSFPSSPVTLHLGRETEYLSWASYEKEKKNKIKQNKNLKQLFFPLLKIFFLP